MGGKYKGNDWDAAGADEDADADALIHVRDNETMKNHKYLKRINNNNNQSMNRLIDNRI